MSTKPKRLTLVRACGPSRQAKENTVEPMDMKKFAEKLKALLREAEDAGLDVDDFCQIAEEIIANGWEA